MFVTASTLFIGLPAPVVHPEYVNMVIFRENTEDVYSGIEFELDSEENSRFSRILKEQFPSQFKKVRFPETTSYGIKPISVEGSRRLVISAIRWAIKNGRKSVTLMHKGNIMKFTEVVFGNGDMPLPKKSSVIRYSPSFNGKNRNLKRAKRPPIRPNRLPYQPGNCLYAI